LFWCSEHVFEAVVGVDEAISGYAGGTTKNLRMNKLVLTILHAEAIAVYYDPKVISLGISECFSRHKTRQTPRARSWFFLSLYCLYKMQQRRKLLKIKLRSHKVFANPIVTEVKPVTDFYKEIIIKIM
jgi:peptide-methionine (S)-S-oxide reductase